MHIALLIEPTRDRTYNETGSGFYPHEPVDLNRRGFRLYEAFRPLVQVGEMGWGAEGELDLAKVRALVSTG